MFRKMGQRNGRDSLDILILCPLGLWYTDINACSSIWQWVARPPTVDPTLDGMEMSPEWRTR